MRTSDLVDLDVDRVVDHRIDPGGREAGVPPRVRIERRDAHQPVHARFGLEPAIGVRAADLEGGGLDAGLFAGALLLELDLVAVRLRPAHVEPQQHLRPVLALGAAGAGVDFEIGVVGVGLAGQQRFQPALGGIGLQLEQRVFRIRQHRLVALRLGKLDQADRVVELGAQRVIGPHGLVEMRALAQQRLRLGRIVPQGRIAGLRVQLREFLDCVVVVKDASSAVPATA